MVYGADFANCNGEYRLSNATVGWAPLRPVYRHIVKHKCDLSIINSSNMHEMLYEGSSSGMLEAWAGQLVKLLT